MRNLTYTIITALAISFAGPAKAQDKSALIDTLMHRTNSKGLFKGNLLVVDGGKPVYQAAIGYADTTKKVKLTNNYRFHIGSIAKEFNAVAIMMMKEKGKLSLDDKIAKFLPNLPAWAQKVSVRNLLQYTSGVPEIKWKTVKTDADAMADMQQLQLLDFEPGTQYAYANSNTFLQRQIIEKLSGMSFTRFVTEKMLKPLGMSASIVDPDDATPLMAKSYNNNNVQPALIYPISGWTAVTLSDFYKWEQGLESFKLISPASTKDIATPFVPGKQCGLGEAKIENNKLVFHDHDGTTMQYQALLLSEQPKGRSIILMTNNKQNNLRDIAAAITNILDGKTYKQPGE